MRSACILTAAAAATTAAALAPAQTFTPRIGFRNDHVLSRTPTVTEIVATGAAPIPVGVLFGAFDAQGFTNRGMFNFIATVTVNDPLGLATLRYRTDGTPGSGLATPYNFGSIEVLQPGGTAMYFDANRGIGGESVPFFHGVDPEPVDVYVYPAGSGGPDNYFPGERLFLDIGSEAARDITITVSGEMQAITSWFSDSMICIDPDPPSPPLCFQSLIPAGFVAQQASETLSVHVPAPPASAVVFIGAAAGLRRRRSRRPHVRPAPRSFPPGSMLMRTTIVVPVVLGLAAAASAQTFTPRIGFRPDHTLSGTPTATEISPGELSVPIGVLFGAFDAQGFTNRGMFNFIGTVTVNDPVGEATLVYRTGVAGSGLRTPYNFGAVESIDPSGTQLYFDANRGAGQVSGLLWWFMDPHPSTFYTYTPFTGALGSGGGPDTYFPGERFFVEFDTFAPRDIVITVTGTMQAITEWYVLREELLWPEGDYAVDLLPGGFLEAQASATFVIHIIPAPGAAALLGLGGIAASRRGRPRRGG